MVMDLKHVIDKLKKDGVEEADRQKDKIISAARKEAEQIVKKAQEKKEGIIKKAEEDAQKTKKTTEEAMKQAARDLVLGLREEISALFKGALKKEVAEELGSDNLKEIIISLAGKFVEAEGGPVEVLMSEKDKQRLFDEITRTMKEQLEQEVELKLDKNLRYGFKIGIKDSHSFYDFSDEAISEAFFHFLNPKVKELLEKESTQKK